MKAKQKFYSSKIGIYTEHMKTSVDLQIEIENSTYAEVVREMPLRPDAITQLVTSEDGEYVYALTAQQVSIHVLLVDITSELQSEFVLLAYFGSMH